tara:strand:+ start:950 stop:2449 length:1500 start_codon:yes stop_codon:yes gene_type:complete
MSAFIIKDNNISFADIFKIINKDLKLTVDDSIIEKISKSRKIFENTINNSDDKFYGINTGFGDLHNVKIKNDHLSILQKNLIKSHACGAGEKIDSKIVKIMILLKIISLTKGYSGIKTQTIERLLFFFNNKIFPVVYKYGSLGASGDLAPLSHLSLPLIGLGEVEFNGEICNTEIILSKFKLNSLTLGAKEGLALINGTQYMLASLIDSTINSINICNYSDLIASISLDAFKCSLSPFDPLISKIRPHEGQINVSKNILKNLEGGEITDLKKENVQDPYSFRCIPQVHGATQDTLKYCINIVSTEINSVTDNPLIFQDDSKIISAGNFHGQPLAYAIDFLKISMSELGNISERRVFNLLSGKRNLPPFLSDDPGLNSGLMILQYTSASLVSSNKQLSTPSSIDSITSSNGQEDHVSMGANGANQLRDIIDNLFQILAIETIVSAQAKEFNNHKSSKIIKEFISHIRKLSPKITDDRVLHNDIRKVSNYLRKKIKIDLFF